MDIIEDLIEARYIIRSYSTNEVVVNKTGYKKSLILSANIITEDWPVSHPDQLDDKNLALILSHSADVVIIGCDQIDNKIRHNVMHFFSGNSAGVEIMSIAAACRTYRILAAENREVVAALILG